MSDHPINHDDLTENPMAGYKPVDKPKHCKTMMMPAYTPEQARQRDGGSKALAPTEEMEAIPTIPVITVKNVVQEICEVNIHAWLKLPQNLRDKLLTDPSKVKFYRYSSRDVPGLIFNGIQLRYENDAWTLHSVLEIK